MGKNEDMAVPFWSREDFGIRSYRYMGAHRKGERTVFRFLAPHAESVCLVGDFNAWGGDLPMQRITESGIWEIETDRVWLDGGELYKYRLRAPEGDRYVTDPYAFCLRMPPETASAVYDIEGYDWRDGGWLKRRGEYRGEAVYKQPLNVYEVFLGSWLRHADGRTLSYRELIFELIPYVKQMGYTHVEFMDAVMGGFAPNACHGEPKALMALIDALHEAGIGVIVRLTRVDADPELSDDGGLTAASALFLVEYYHVDGLLVDATCREIYKKLNAIIKAEYPDVLTVAESASREDGFDFTLNKAWGDDVLSYVSLDHPFRRYHHGKISRVSKDMDGRDILPVSYDMVTGGKKSFLGKMNGEYKHKFDEARATLVYIMTHPCKKLMFMGGEIGQFREWDGSGTEWFLTEYESHAMLQRFFAELGHFYLENSPLYECDGGDGFVPIEQGDSERSILSYCRVGKDGGELLTVINFSPVCYREFEQKVPHPGVYREVLNSDACAYGGAGNINGGDFSADAENRIRITLPPYGASVFKWFQK